MCVQTTPVGTHTGEVSCGGVINTVPLARASSAEVIGNRFVEPEPFAGSSAFGESAVITASMFWPRVSINVASGPSMALVGTSSGIAVTTRVDTSPTRALDTTCLRADRQSELD